MTRYLKMLAMAFVALAAAAGGSRDAQSEEWGALAFGSSGRGVAWAFSSRDSERAADTAAVNRCQRLLGSSCESWGTFVNSCGAIAVSECPRDSCSRPAYGFATRGNRSEATRAAIAQCERATSASISGTCRVSTSDQGEAGVICVGRAR